MNISAKVTRVPDDLFCFTNVTFAVENMLFCVPRQVFERSSEVFQDMFSMPSGNQNVEGKDAEHPIILEDVTSSDFKQLLRVMFSRSDLDGPDTTQPLTFDEWTGVIRLTHKWEMRTLHQSAINSASKMSGVDPVQKLSIAMAYHIEEWLRPALNGIACRKETLSPRDVEILGVDMVLKLARVREDSLTRACLGKRKTEDRDFEVTVDNVFGDFLPQKKRDTDRPRLLISTSVGNRMTSFPDGRRRRLL
ncbi:hypothetical protein CONPUDRAFT_108685 [Coniophora puteana RWD-64-598 SS2]|uniref:BTB domain-containing protein n=1 Tax=Coniophora puteana (strain RWD-64-598) TaxID=741705 RepID=A0A5M3MJ81_CONPW|nr:uncharacterized protein CONPUDRAFT_108685 [Coniophora puteana RWD-64-598 SS2]EIW78695.1 hypothetical protein CONPUDRAFT_108685 [Coniophora puteana RWD-64-598 SS2]